MIIFICIQIIIAVLRYNLIILIYVCVFMQSKLIYKNLKPYLVFVGCNQKFGKHVSTLTNDIHDTNLFLSDSGLYDYFQHTCLDRSSFKKIYPQQWFTCKSVNRIKVQIVNNYH